MDVVEFFHRTVAAAGERVHAVGDDAWGNDTPCAEWDVRQVVAHVVEELAWVPPLVEGSTIDDVGDRLAGDLLGADAAAAWDARAAAAVAASDGPGVADRIVHLSFGDAPGAEYLNQVGTDALIHGWDIARGAGGDVVLPVDLVAHAAEWFATMEDLYRSAGAIGPRVELPDGVDAQARLLASFGRSSS